MKIVIATPLFPPETGSPASYVYELASRLKKRHKDTVLTYADHVEKIESVRIRKVQKSAPLLIRLYKYTQKLTQLAKDADIIYVQHSATSGFPTILAKWLSKTPVVIHYIEDEAWQRYLTEGNAPIHQGAFRKNKKISGDIWGVWHMQHFALQHATKILAPSKYVASELAHVHKLKKEQVTILPKAPEKLPTLPSAPEKKEKQIFMDTPFYPWADVQTALRAIKKVREVHSDIELVIAGDGVDRTLIEELITKLEIEKNILLLGNVSKAEKQYYLKSSAVYLSTATFAERFETLFAAFMSKVPVIVTDVPGIREGIEHEKTGLLTQPGNANITASMLLRAIEDISLAETLVANALHHFTNNYSWEAHITNLEKTCSTLCYKS